MGRNAGDGLERWPRTIAACACSRAAMRASGVFAMGTGTGGGVAVEEEGVADEDGILAELIGGGDGVEAVPCIALSIQLVICAALKASALGSLLEGSSW